MIYEKRSCAPFLKIILKTKGRRMKYFAEEGKKTVKPSEVENKTERRYDIDWLRVFAMFSVFLIHNAIYFTYYSWYVKNPQTSRGMTIFATFLLQWTVPLFFFLAGENSRFSLSLRTGGQFIKERFMRLIIPFLFGVLIVIAPLQVYFQRVSRLHITDSFIEFYPQYFKGFYGFGGNFAWHGHHLWFLLALFIFSLLLLPLFIYLKKESVQRRISRMAIFFKKPGAIFLLGIPLVIIELLVNLQPSGIGMKEFGGWSPVIYPIFFLYGYIFASDENFKETIEKHRIISLVMGTVLSAFVLFVGFAPNFKIQLYKYIPNFPKEIFSLIDGIILPFSCWFLLIAILGFGSKYLNFNNRVLKYSNEAVLPFYILHQTIIITIDFYLVSWNVAVILKYLIIGILSFASIILIYHLIIKRINWLRFLFGMRPRK